ncbi:hypothetical protein FHETE_10793 [Fusarium heterosporum]|uniref:Uncharacterized protein n=1 Tax=Fusarium heterosporum TaxID=42747 RepID=A0A8H5WG00_FUSHE|nr:hypothetical protein FHETE_10793 [Fusarium heterosporum]
MSDYITESDSIAPPNDWTNAYEEMGGDMMWAKGSQIEDEIHGRGFEGDIKPHFGMSPYTGETLYLFELGDGQFFVFNALDGSLLQIRDQNDLKSIVDILDDNEKGLPCLDVEEI